MKKKFSLLLALLLSLGTVVGCNKTPNSGFVGTFWLESYTVKTVQPDFYEKIEYKVSSTEKDDKFAPALYDSNDGYLNFYVDEEKSSYVTELYSENGLYVYKTRLVVFGQYTFGQSGVYTVEGDVTETETTFKGMEDGFACVKSVKRVKNVYPVEQAPTTVDDFVTVTADFTVEYTDKSATLTVSAKDEVSKAHLSAVAEPVTVKKYNKKAFIDNELMLLIFRNFKYENTLSYTFNTIETSTGGLKEINGSAYLTSESVSSDVTKQTAIKTIDMENSIDNLGVGRLPRKINAFGITLKTTGEFSQSFAYVYYANSIGDDVNDAQNKSRHYMVKCFRPAIYNIGYLVYTLDTVSHTR
ncbi:MAG: hypothetical protein IKA61_00925 [Clostridia bacterium]|nr:hypothetical protein [Clostridia bacterium]